jgi:hypothetical protein
MEIGERIFDERIPNEDVHRKLVQNMAIRPILIHLEQAFSFRVHVADYRQAPESSSTYLSSFFEICRLVFSFRFLVMPIAASAAQ